jgi:hypothetical protein
VIGILITRKKIRRQLQEERDLLEGFDTHAGEAAGAR